MEYIRTLRAPEPGLYTQGILVDPATHKLLFLSGQTGNMPGIGNEPVIDDTVYGQTLRALKNLMAVVLAAGGNTKSLVALDVFLKDSGTENGRKKSREDFNAAYREFFEISLVPKEKLPTRCLVWVSEVPLEYPLENTLVEIKGVAAIPRSQ